jgi:multiple sugar transport system permease protein
MTGYYSITDYNTLTNASNVIGLDNYKRMFSDPLFWKALGNTFAFTLGTVPFSTTFALLLAAMLNSKSVKFQSLFKSSFFLPSMTSLVVVSLIFTNLYAMNGYINSILSTLGFPFPRKGWLMDPRTSLGSIMVMDVWSATGYYMIIFLAAMQAIPRNLYDQARLVGASARYQLLHITLPMLRSTLAFVLVINVIKSFQVFMEIYIMTKGGPLNSTTTIVYMIFTNGFEKTNAMGYAAAISYLLFFLLLVVSFVQLKFINRKN